MPSPVKVSHLKWIKNILEIFSYNNSFALWKEHIQYTWQLMWCSLVNNKSWLAGDMTPTDMWHLTMQYTLPNRCDRWQWHTDILALRCDMAAVNDSDTVRLCQLPVLSDKCHWQLTDWSADSAVCSLLSQCTQSQYSIESVLNQWSKKKNFVTGDTHFLFSKFHLRSVYVREI